MNEKNKNVIIGGLLAIVFVMAVGYAAFSTTLNINGTAKVDSNWDIEYDTTKETGTGVIDATPASGVAIGTTNTPNGTINFTDKLNAKVSANLYQPGDKVTFTLTILNKGSLDAKLGKPSVTPASGTIALAGDTTGLVYTSANGNVKFTVSNTEGTNLTAETGSATVTVTAEYVAKDAQTNANEETATIDVAIIATQA